MDYLAQSFGFTIHYNRMIGAKSDLDMLEKTYHAVFLGVGLGPTLPTRMKGENLPGCIGATEFIKDLKLNKERVDVPSTAVVLGGGNTAMEAARLGAEKIVIVYRRSRGEKKAYEFEYDLAKGVGVSGFFNAAPVEILGGDRVEGIRLVRTENRGVKLEMISGSEFEIACDIVIRATGQEKKVEFLKLIDSLAIDEGGRIVVNKDNFQTGNPKYFAGGDAVNGGAEAVNAAAEGKQAAQGIFTYLTKGGKDG